MPAPSPISFFLLGPITHVPNTVPQPTAVLLVKIFFLFYYLFIQLGWVLVVAGRIFALHVAWGIFSCGMLTLSCSMWDLVPRLGIKPGNLIHWATREVPSIGSFYLDWIIFMTLSSNSLTFSSAISDLLSKAYPGTCEFHVLYFSVLKFPLASSFYLLFICRQFLFLYEISTVICFKCVCNYKSFKIMANYKIFLASFLFIFQKKLFCVTI